MHGLVLTKDVSIVQSFHFEHVGGQLGSVGNFESSKFKELSTTEGVTFSQVFSVMQGNYALQTLEIKMDMRALSEFFKREKFLRLTDDLVFKAFLIGDESLLKSLLQSFLPLPDNSFIESVVVLNPELTSQRLAQDAGKTYILDLKVKFTHHSSDGAKTETVGVEMQTTNKAYFIKRLMAYSGRVYSDQLERGEDYEKLASVYSLVFITRNLSELVQVKGRYFHVCSLSTEATPHVVISKALKFVIVELGKFTKSAEKLDNPRDKWCYMLKNSHKLGIKECRELLKRGDQMKNTLKHLWGLSLDPKLREEALAIDKQRRDRSAEKRYAREEGRQEGQEAKAMEIARKLLVTGADLKFVSETTGLSLEQLQKLKKEDP